MFGLNQSTVVAVAAVLALFVSIQMVSADPWDDLIYGRGGRANAPAPAAPQPNGGGMGDARAPHTLRFSRVSVFDRMIGCDAFSFLLPNGWQTRGGVEWRNHPAVPAGASIKCFDPNSLAQFETQPWQPSTWNPRSCGPGRMFPVGSMWFGNEVRPPVRGPIEAITEVVIPRFRPGIRGRIVTQELMPELADAIARLDPPRAMPGMRSQLSAARVRIEYAIQGVAVEEDVFCVLNTTFVQPDTTLQIILRIHLLRAEKGRLDSLAGLFKTMISSVRITLPWFNQYSQLVEALIRANIQHIRDTGEFSRWLARTNSEITEDRQRQWERRQAANDRLNKNYSQYQRGVEEYRDPKYGGTVELPAGYTNAWVNDRGEYVVTDSQLFNPNVDWKDGNYRPLPKAGN